ncbi:MAG TPA: TaqI-like C-terminal specificity domain-containing protein [Bryobacteraceae bacterium]|nr:TaqI-like C-terminal specificity domain-containing protein [Bryobacteraceae bacterium]
MSKTFDQGKEEVAVLCRYFAANRQAFLAPGVKEAHLRQSLIDPLFESLGWDVRNALRAAPQYREVVPGDSLDVEDHQRAPDYTFRAGSSPAFYAEARKCGAMIDSDPAPAYQLRRYGWSARVALSILTDFEELGVYDCTFRPRPGDKACRARTQYFRFEEYPDRWRELWDVFSREAVWSGAFDRYAASRRKRATSEVDVELLREIEGWRNALAGNFALRNKDLPPDELNASVQLTIDRMVFLRMAEDRGLEPYEQLLKLCERPDIYVRFMHDLCRSADEKYNSGLFHFRKEDGVHEAPDRITPGLTLDDKVFKPILESLYFAHGSPYHFGVLPVEILGTVYERFLGKAIRLTAGHQAKVEEKAEVRKAGGVYYTPAYIVDYIVKRTAGEQIQGRSPAQLAGENGKPPYRILDMACGSGSFLLGAYRGMLSHCLNWNIEHRPENSRKGVYQDLRSGEWRLTIEEKKRILTAHIFGVDVDPQAVEVTKLSLLLKVLEGESDQSLALSQLSFGERALPNLAGNIKCGNSLIGPDYFRGRLSVDAAEMRRVNPLDWRQEFPGAMEAGGFDCIIGNPPYVQLSMEAFRDEAVNQYLRETYQFSGGRLNTFAFFIERARQLTREAGKFAYIVPNTVLSQEYYEEIRRKLLGGTHINSVVAPEGHIFKDAVIENVILVLDKQTSPKRQGTTGPGDRVEFLRLHENGLTDGRISVTQRELAENYKASFIAPANPQVRTIRTKLEGSPYTFGHWLNINQAIALKHDRAACLADHKQSPLHREVLDGRHIGRYFAGESPNYFAFDVGKIHSCRREDIFLLPEKILFRRVGDRLIGCLDTEQKFALNTLVVMSPKAGCPYSLRFILALFNSSLLNFYYVSFLKSSKRAFSEIQARQVAQLPFPAIDLSGLAGQAAHDRLVTLADSMMALHGQFAAAKSAAEEAILQRRIGATDAEIDRLVYDLYELTAGEIDESETWTATISLCPSLPSRKPSRRSTPDAS